MHAIHMCAQTHAHTHAHTPEQRPTEGRERLTGVRWGGAFRKGFLKKGVMGFDTEGGRNG